MSRESNPYSLVFGKEPAEMISRGVQSEEVLKAFLSEPAIQQIFMITGIRGSGKTVMMTEICRQIQENKDWIVVELNPDRDMLVSLASKLSSDDALATIFKEAKLNLSLFGFGLEVTTTAPIADIETVLERMLASLQKKGKKVLVAVDETVSSKEMRIFASAYQILVRQNLPIFLLMTGLYENIHRLQNEDSLTFLYRAPKIDLRPLNIGVIAESYQRNFSLTEEKALAMAKMTKGYSFAFQVLGHFMWEEGEFNPNVAGRYKQYLDEYVYDKIWAELSRGDKRVIHAIACSESGKISEIREALQLETNQFNPYRDRLIKRGIIDGSQYGYVQFQLPLFEKYAKEHYEGK